MKTSIRLFLLAVFFLTFFFSFGFPKEMTPVLEGNLPSNNPQVIEDNVLKENFKDFKFAVIGLECLNPESVYTANCITRIRELEERVKNSNVIAPEAVVYSFPGYDYIENTEDGFVEVSDLVKQIPNTKEEEEALKNKVRNDPLIFGKLISKDEHASLMVFRLNTRLSQNEIFDELEALADSYTDGNLFKAGVYSNDYQNRWFEILAQREIGFLGIFALIFLVLTMTNVLGWRAFPCMIAAISVSYIWSLGILGYLGFKENVLTSSLPVVLIAIVSSYGYHVIEDMRSNYRRNNDLQKALKSPFRRMMRPVFGAAVTSTMGFVTLVSVPIVALRDFGLFATLGILVGAFGSLFMIPAIATIWPKVVTSPETARARWVRGKVNMFLNFANTQSFLRRKRVRVFTLASLVFFGMFFGVQKIDIDSKPAHFIPKGEKARDGFDILENHFGGTGFTHIVLDCNEEGGIESPSCLKEEEAVSGYSETLPDVVFSTGLHDRISRLYREMMNEGPQYERIPDDRNLISQLMLIDNQDVLKELKSEDNRYLVVNMFIYAFNADRINAIKNALKNYRDEHALNGKMFLAGEFFVWSEMIQQLGYAWIKSNALLVVLLVLVSWVFLQNIRLAFLGLMPVIFANWFVFGLMGFLGVTIDIANFAITLIVGATVIDFYIHMANRARMFVKLNGATNGITMAIKDVGVPIIYDCLSNLSFIALVASAFIPVKILGIMLSVAMVVALVATIFIVPSIMRAMPMFFFKKELEEFRKRNLKLYVTRAV